MIRCRSSGRLMNSSISCRMNSFETSLGSAFGRLSDWTTDIVEHLVENVVRLVPFLHSTRDRLEVLDRGLQWDRALRADELDARVQIAEHLLPDHVLTFREERLWVVDVS